MEKPILEKEGDWDLMPSYLGLTGSTLPHLLGLVVTSTSGYPAGMHILMDLRGSGPCSEADFILGRLLECCELCWALGCRWAAGTCLCSSNQTLGGWRDVMRKEGKSFRPLSIKVNS